MVNRILFTYWQQGIDAAPPVVRMCLSRMQQMAPEWDIRILDRESASAEMKEIPVSPERFECLKIPHQSDLLRTHLLIKYGGVWADPTVFFSQPLDNWIHSVTTGGLFIFVNPGRDRLISNWFIASDPGNLLLGELYSRLCTYWNENRFRNLSTPPGALERFLSRALNRNRTLPRLWLRSPIRRILRIAPYMIYHYQFHDLVCGDADCRASWKKAGKLPAVGPIRLLRHGLLNPVSDEVMAMVEKPVAPVFKLTWKLPDDEIPEGSVLDYLSRRTHAELSAE